MPTNPDNSLVQYTPAQIASWNLGTRGIDDGTNPEERYSPDGCGCTRKWLCNWNNRFDAITYMLGQVTLFTNSETGLLQLSRLSPQLHPTQPWACVSARVSGHLFLNDVDPDGTGGNLIPNWDAAEIETEYSVYPVNSLAADGAFTSEIDRYVTEPGMIGADSTSTAQYLEMPGGILAYKTPDGTRPNNIQIQTNVGITVGEQEVKAIWRRLPPKVYDPLTSPLFARVFGNPPNGILPYVGSMNQHAIFGRPPLTMLLLPPEEKTIPDPTAPSGQQLEITYRWIYRPQTHAALYFFDTAGAAGGPVAPNGYYQISKPGVAYKDPTTFGDGDTLFWVRDHSQLFQPY